MTEAQRRIRTCRILSGRLMSCAGSIRTARWALDTDLSIEMKKKLDNMEAELIWQAQASEAEAAVLAATAEGYAIAGKKED